jgi:IclR family transcriptional regulator, pca regulon regulatory protein
MRSGRDSDSRSQVSGFTLERGFDFLTAVDSAGSSMGVEKRLENGFGFTAPLVNTFCRKECNESTSSFLQPLRIGPRLLWRMRGHGPATRNSYVRSLARGLSVICSFRADRREQTVSQVAAATELDRAGARRMLRTLENLGYVQHDGGKFQLTPRVLELAHVYLSATPLRRIAEPAIEQLVKAVHESCALCVLDGTAVMCVLMVPANRIMTAQFAAGDRFPAYCTSPGRILLGSLSKGDLDGVLEESDLRKYTRRTVTAIPELRRMIRRGRERGWTLLNQEFEEGACSLSVPIVEPASEQIIAALNVVAALSRRNPKNMITTVLPRLKEAAQQIHSLLSAQAHS